MPDAVQHGIVSAQKAFANDSSGLGGSLPLVRVHAANATAHPSAADLVLRFSVPTPPLTRNDPSMGTVPLAFVHRRG
jgi:hypothetical protein